MPFRRRAAFLMALILALYGMLHAWCLPAMALPGGLVAVCTAHGVEWVPADAPDAPVKPRHDCPACRVGHAGADLLPPPPVEAPAPPSLFETPEFTGHAPAAGASFRQSPPARGPPAVG